MAWVDRGPERRPSTRRSLYYLVSYLTLLGGALLFAPARTLDLLGATGSYDGVFPRVAGMFLLGLAMISGSIIFLKLDVLYVGVVLVRVFFSLTFLVVHHETGDPVFLAFFGFVFLGVVLTSSALLVDGRRERLG